MSKPAVSAHNQVRLVAAQSEPSPSQTQPEITSAAQKLGSQPKLLFQGRRRQLRKWTGFVSGKRCWIGRLVVLPDGRVAELRSAFRGTALVRLCQNDATETTPEFLIPTKLLWLWKNPAAVAMGRLKRGTHERRSAKKAMACCRNARMPAKPGNRVRGRPRQNAPAWRQFVLKTNSTPPKRLTVESLLKWAIQQRAELEACLKSAAAANHNAGTTMGASDGG